MNNDINEKIVHAAPVPPFVRFVASAVPMVFDNSLSYYEALCALWKWMQDNLVNVVNNNASVTEHYIELTNDLKEFVENYFANLDVQDEINNKLDEMAEAGTLQEIITAYIQANVAWCFDSVTDMKQATNLVNGSYAQTLGFHTLNDGGGAIYKISDTGIANEMDIIAVGGLYANLVYGKEINVKQLGAYGDNSHDDIDTIQYAVDYGLTNGKNDIYLPKGQYIIHKAIVLPEHIRLYGEDKFVTSVIKTTNDIDETYSVDSVIIFKPSAGFVNNYNHSQNVSKLTIKGNESTEYAIYAYKAVPYTLVEKCNISNVNTGIYYANGGWLYNISNTNIGPRVNGFVNRGASTTLALNSIYVNGGNGVGYDIQGVTCSNFNNIACDGCTGVPYKFSFCSIDINGLGCECANSTKYIDISNSDVKINNALVFVNDDNSYVCINGGGSTLKLSDHKFQSGASGDTNAGKFLNAGTDLKVEFENCTLNKPFTIASTSSSQTNVVKIVSKNGSYVTLQSSKLSGLGNVNSTEDSFMTNSGLAIGMGGIFFNVKGQPRYGIDGTDRRWSQSHQLGDILVNQAPELNGVAMYQQSSSYDDVNFAGTVSATNISGTSGNITLTSLNLDSDAVSMGIRVVSNMQLTTSSGGKGDITSVDYANNKINLSNITGTINVGDTLVYKGTKNYNITKHNSVQYIGYGITALRPASAVNGFMYFDTTLGKPIWKVGGNWKDATGTNV